MRAFWRNSRAGGYGLVLMTLGAFASMPAAAQRLAALPSPDTIGPIASGGQARPVTAWLRFCERYAGECDVDRSEPETVELTPTLWQALNSVNLRVNRTLRPTTDLAHWGVVDKWDIPDDGAGDCEDYQLLKRKVLHERYGVPRRALRMTVVIDEDGEGHAVLMARTKSGEFILDNKRDAVLPWHQTGYVFVKREGQDGRAWVSLGDRSSPITTANR